MILVKSQFMKVRHLENEMHSRTFCSIVT